jgi:hypothetical protein
VLKRCPDISIETGDELKLADFGEHLRKGITKIRRFRPPLLDSFLLEVLGVDAELQSLTVRLQVTSSDDGKSWPKLGFRVLREKLEGGEEPRP